MIWYDTSTKAPVAPGSCEDSGVPSIKGYNCQECNNYELPEWETHTIEVDTQLKPVIEFSIGVCPICGHVVLTTLL